MDFGLNQDQETLQKYARDFLDNECPAGLVRRMAFESETAYDEGLHKHMAALGWTAIAIDEAHGGQGMTYVDLAVLLEEMGRALVPGPFFTSVCLAAPVIQEAGSDTQCKELLADIASGDGLATVAFTEASGRVDAEGITMGTSQDGDGFTLSGTKTFVPDAHIAGHLVVAARTDEDGDPETGITLFLVPRDAPGLSVTQLQTMDLTRRWCRVRFENVPVGMDAVLGEVNMGWGPLSRGLQRATAMLCAESVGGSQRVLDMSVEYARERVQFGRPIGSFQAVKHRCAEMLVDVEMARSAVYYAAWAASHEPAELRLASSVAKAYCSDAYNRIAASGIQVHGGIGFTWEHDMHLYFKRAKTNEALLGDPTYHREIVTAIVA